MHNSMDQRGYVPSLHQYGGHPIKMEVLDSCTKRSNNIDLAACDSFLDSLTQESMDHIDNDLEVASVLSMKDKRSKEATSSTSPDKDDESVNPSPYRPSTVITNFTRGNVQTTTPNNTVVEHMSIHQMAAQGELVLLQHEIMNPEKDIDKVDDKGFTALLWACANGQKSAAELLLYNHANIEARGHGGETALLLASCYGHIEVVALLLEKGAAVNVCDEQGNTSLMYAAFNNNHKSASLLLEHGADITLENEEELSAMDLAVRRASKNVQQVLEYYMLQLLEGTSFQRY